MEIIYIQRNGESEGPYPQDRLKDWLKSGFLSPETLCRIKGEEEWIPLSALFVPKGKGFEVKTINQGPAWAIEKQHAYVSAFLGLFFLVLNLALLHFDNLYYPQLLIFSPFLIFFGFFAMLRISLWGPIQSDNYNLLDVVVVVVGLGAGIMCVAYVEYGAFADIFNPLLQLVWRFFSIRF